MNGHLSLKATKVDNPKPTMDSCETCNYIRDASCIFAENEHLIATLDNENHEVIILKEHVKLTPETLEAIYKIVSERFSDAEEIEFQTKDQHIFIHIHA